MSGRVLREAYNSLFAGSWVSRMWCVLANPRRLKIYLAICPVSLWSEVRSGLCKTRSNLSMNWKELAFKRCLALKLCSLSTVSF